MNKRIVLLGGVMFASLIGCGSTHSVVKGSGDPQECRAGSDCVVPIAAKTSFWFGCQVLDPMDYPDIKVPAGSRIVWQLDKPYFGKLEFVDDPGVQIVDAAPDFTPIGFGVDKSSYAWKAGSKEDRNGEPRHYKFHVQFVPDPAWADKTIDCGSIDPTIVNSL